MTEQQLDEINLYPEMNAKIVVFLAGSDEPLYQYSAALLKHLQKENATLKKALEETERIKNDYFSQLQSYIKAFRLHQLALELAVPNENDQKCYLRQAQEQEAEK